MNTEKQKEILVELQGEFKKLRPPMFDGEFEEAIESWLLNMLYCGRRLKVSVTDVVKSWVGFFLKTIEKMYMSEQYYDEKAQ